MRLADAYRRLHPRTSGSDDSTVHSSDSTQTNETELSPLGDEARAWVQERVASAHESEAHDALSTSTPPPPPAGLATRGERYRSNRANCWVGRAKASRWPLQAWRHTHHHRLPKDASSPRQTRHLHQLVSRRRPAAAYYRLLASPHAIAATRHSKTAQRNAQNHLPSTTPREQPVQSGGRRRLPHRDRIHLLLLTSGELLLQ